MHVIKSSASKRRKLDLTGGATKVRSPLLENVGKVSSVFNVGILGGKATGMAVDAVPLEDKPNDRRDEKEEEDDDDDGDLPEIPSSFSRDAEQDTNVSLSESVIQTKEGGGESAQDSDDSEDLFEISDTPQTKSSTFRERLKVYSAGKKRRMHEEKGGEVQFFIGKIYLEAAKKFKERERTCCPNNFLASYSCKTVN